MKPVNWKQVKSYPGRLLEWLTIGSLPIITAIINLATINFAWFWLEYDGHENHVRIAAVLLQVVGWLGVFKGILDTRAQFGLPKTWAAFTNWLTSFPALFPKPVAGYMSATLNGVSLFSSASASNAIDPNASVEIQIKQIIAAIEQIRKDSQATRNQLDDTAKDLRAAIDNERRAREGDIEGVRATLNSHATGGIILTLCGAICFLVGGVLGTLPYKFF